jgi:glutathione gamma-glutamylcysteinyltransferase
VKERGLTLEQVACLASCNGAKAEVALAHDNGEQEHSEDAFREAVSKNARQTFGQVLIVSYDRSKLGQTGAGHFSPLAGYHEESDRVLVLDVARFKYPSHWLRVKDLFAAMLSVDPQSNKSRGWLTLTEATESRRLALAFENTGLNSPLLPFVGDELNRVFTSQRPQSVDGALDLAVAQLAPLAETIQPRSHADTETQSQVDAVLCQLRNTPLFSALSQRPQVSHPEVLTGLLMCFPSSVFAPLPPDVASGLEQLRMNDPPALHDEPAW